MCVVNAFMYTYVDDPGVIVNHFLRVHKTSGIRIRSF